MKNLISLILFLLISTDAYNQSVRISVTDQTSDHTISDFLFGDFWFSYNGQTLSMGDKNIAENKADLSYAGMVAAFEEDGIRLLGPDGTSVLVTNYNPEAADQSSNIWLSKSGEFVVRENIANFLLYDNFGNLKTSISNSSQSREGESISEFSSDPYFTTKVLYNPKIIMNNAEGSRIRIVESRGTTTDIFNSQDEIILKLKVSNDGAFITAVTSDANGNNTVRIFDRFGNEIQSISFDQDVAGFQLSQDGKYITIYSNSRVGVYDVITGEREASTSVRNRIQFADFIPQDQNIFMVTGDKTGIMVQDLEFRLVNIQQRKISSGEYSGTAGTTDLIPFELQREGANSYLLKGMSKHFRIRATF